MKNCFYILAFIVFTSFFFSCQVVRYNKGSMFSKNAPILNKGINTPQVSRSGNVATNLAIPIIKLIAEVVKVENNTKNKPIAKLKWLTDTTKKQGQVELYYSLNGMDWAEVACKNLSHYNIADTLFVIDKLPKKGLVHYKIKLEYLDKTVSSSEILTAHITHESMVLNAITASVNDYLKIELFSEKVRECELRITNLIGKTLYNQKITLKTNNNSFNINVESYNKGNYYLEIVDNNSPTVLKSNFYKN